MTQEQAQELLHLLKESQQLGLNFAIGNAYIRSSYVAKQSQLNKKIDALLEGLKAADLAGVK